MTAPAQVVVLGGGFAGLETAFTLRQRLGDRVKLTVVSDTEDFVFKPNTIYLPFGGDEERLHVPLGTPLARRHIDFVPGSVAEVDTDARRVALADGTRLGYDFLVIGTGAAMRPGEVPGLAEYANTIWTPQQMHRLGEQFAQLVRDVNAGQQRNVLFLVPPNNKCAGPLYEIVFMLDSWLRRRGARDGVDISWATFESSYIQAFGWRLHDVVSAEFGARGIAGRVHTNVSKVLPDEVIFEDGTSHSYDLLVAFPPYVAAVDYPALPSDDRGFLRTELGTRRVAGQDGIYAPGDAGDFPVKQAFLAFLQGGAVAEDIAAIVDRKAAGPAKPFEPTAMCVMEMFDKATFAEVPLALTGDPDQPLDVDRTVPDRYRVGVSRPWRLGKWAIGVYLPWRFGAGRPFHSGAPWRVMDAGLRVMSRTLARGAGRRTVSP
ncbi:MAG: NAD(P)/FAD-dependent oxidoreductase, partial [Actinomycetota bacterium]